MHILAALMSAKAKIRTLNTNRWIARLVLAVFALGWIGWLGHLLDATHRHCTEHRTVEHAPVEHVHEHGACSTSEPATDEDPHSACSVVLLALSGSVVLSDIPSPVSGSCGFAYEQPPAASDRVRRGNQVLLYAPKHSPPVTSRFLRAMPA